MTAMLSYPDRQVLLHIVEKQPFVQPMNQWQLTRVGICCLNDWNVVGSGRCEECIFGIYMRLPMKRTETQADKFKQAARDLECDPDEAKWED